MDSSSSYLITKERLCAVFLPLLRLIEAVIFSFSGCFHHHRPSPKLHYSFNDLFRIANNTLFTINEVEAMFEEELRLALLKSTASENLFLDRVFDLFDQKKNGVIEFEEFVYGLSVFHPGASMDKKIDFAFRLYDLGQTGYVERDEVRQMLKALSVESGIQIPKESLEDIIDKTFAEADADMDGKINREEWKAFVLHHPSILNNMTLPCLADITTLFPSFIFNTEVDDCLFSGGNFEYGRDFTATNKTSVGTSHKRIETEAFTIGNLFGALPCILDMIICLVLTSFACFGDI